MKIRVLYRTAFSGAEVEAEYEFLAMSARVLTVRTDQGDKLDIAICQILDVRPV